MRRLMLLVPTRSYRAGDFIAAASRLDLEVVVGSDQPSVLSGVAPDRTLALDFRDPAATAAEIARFAARRPLDAIVAVDDAATVAAARACELLGLPHNSVKSVETARNKYRMREVLAEAGLPSPYFEAFSTGDDPVEIARRIPYPCVLKPVSLAASRGVIRADDPPAFVAAFGRIAAILRDPEVVASRGLEATQILVEGFIPGREAALEGLLVGGGLLVLALFDKPDPLDGPFFEETIYVTPSRLPPAVQRDVERMAERAAWSIGLRDGPLHAELRANDAGVWVIEVAARSIGGLCSRTLQFGTGMSLEEIILRHAAGLGETSVQRQRSAAGVMMIPIPRGGILREVHGVADAEAVEGIGEVRISIAPGHRVVPLPEGNEYLGFIFARGETPEEVGEALREAHARLSFVIEDGP